MGRRRLPTQSFSSFVTEQDVAVKEKVDPSFPGSVGQLGGAGLGRGRVEEKLPSLRSWSAAAMQGRPDRRHLGPDDGVR